MIHKEVTLREMLVAMKSARDDEPFRWYQTSYIGADGNICAGETLLVTVGQARREFGLR